MPYKDKQKGKKYLKEYYKKNRNKFLEKEKILYKNNPEIKKKYSNDYHKKHFIKKELPTEKQLSYWKTLKGKLPWNYKGITPENKLIRNSIEYKLWRKSCFERDNFTCQKTGISGGNLVVHHINNFSDKIELRFAIDNGITLSKKSHNEFHKKYGNKNNTKEQLVEFFNPSSDQQSTVA